MNVNEIKQHILVRLRPHALCGKLKPGRTYEVLEENPAQLRIRTRSKDGKTRQTLFADLQTCKSRQYGVFRRVDLFWGMAQKNQEKKREQNTSVAPDTHAGPDDLVLEFSEHYPNGAPFPVDRFMERGFRGCRIRHRNGKDDE